MVKKIEIICVILMIALLSCGSKTSEQQTTIENSTTEFYIKDKTKYSENFISEFKKYHGIYETVSLIEDTIIINNAKEEFIIIPTDLPLNTIVIYGKTEKDKEQILTVKRINISTLEYYYYEKINDKKTNEKQGTADLEPTFYFETEGTFEDENGNIYGMNEYIDNSEKDCWTYIYIGVGSIEKSFLIYGCQTDRSKFTTPILNKRK